MKKLISAILTGALIVAMSVSVMAACSASAPAKAEETKPATTTMSTGTVVDSQGVVQAFTSAGTPQGVNNAYLSNLASTTKVAGAATTAMTAAENKVVYDYAKTAIGKNCYMITAFKPAAPVAGSVKVDCPNFKAGTNVSILVTTADGKVLVLKPAALVNGSLVVALPDGAVATSVSVFYDAVAPW